MQIEKEYLCKTKKIMYSKWKKYVWQTKKTTKNMYDKQKKNP
jgi:hypothetical protein